MAAGEIMNLVYIINKLDTGGAEVGMCRLLNGLDDEQYDTTVISLNGVNTTFVEGLPDVVTVMNLREGFTLFNMPKIISVVTNADVIVGSLFHSVMVARFSRLLNREAVIATWQHVEKFKTNLRRHLVGGTNGFSDVILADSEPVAEMYRDEFELDEDFVRTVPIAGVRLDEFEPRVHRNRETVIVGSIGRLTPQKNFKVLIEVADELSDEEIEFQIAGDGPKRTELEGLIERKGLENIKLLGEIPNVPKFLTSVDVYTQPSRFEGLCMTVIEAMAAGLPVIASAVGGIKYTVTDGENGYLHPPDDIQGICESIKTLGASPELRQEFGNRGREIVEENYTREILVSRFEEAIGGESL